MKSQRKFKFPTMKMLKSRMKRRFQRLLFAVDSGRLTEKLSSVLSERRPGLDILSPSPGDDSTFVDWMNFNHKLLFDGPKFQLQIGPFTLEIPALTSCDLEELRQFATLGEVNAWMRKRLRATGPLSRLIARTIGIENLLYNYVSAQGLAESAAELWKLNTSVKKKTWVTGPSDAPSHVLISRLTDSSSNLVFDVWDLVITGDN